MPKKKAPAVTSFRLPGDVHAFLKKEARRQEISMAAVIIALVRKKARAARKTARRNPRP